jgi:hypothetical protein
MQLAQEVAMRRRPRPDANWTLATRRMESQRLIRWAKAVFSLNGASSRSDSRASFPPLEEIDAHPPAPPSPDDEE